jgi:hypothetical protein
LPFRTEDEKRFDAYAAKVLKSARFTPDADASENGWDIFRSSLHSTWDHLGGTTPKRRQDGRQFRLAAGFVDLVSPTAFASLKSGTHLIGVHTGLVAAMQEISLFFYAQSSFFPEVGNPGVETSPKLDLGSSLSLTVIDMTRQADTSNLRAFGEKITPHDATRYLHAQYMTLLLLRFAWYHEFYHCANGHVGLVQHLGMATALCEVPDAAHKPLTEAALPAEIAASAFQVSHCLELDADRSALWAFAKIQLSEHENVRGIDRLDLKLRMKMVLFSAFLVTHFFAEANRRASQPSMFHPPADIRLHNLVRTIASNLLDEYPPTQTIFASVLNEFASLEDAVPSLMRTSDLLRDFRSETFQGKLENSEAILIELRKIIRKFSYIR